MQGEPFKDVQVFYDGLGRTAVSWVLDPRFDDPFPHTFELQFAKSSPAFFSNEYTTIARSQDVTFLPDNVFRDSSINSQAFYRIRLITPAGEYLSRVKGLTGNVSKRNIPILKEIIRKENLAMRKDRGGIFGYLFKERYYGPSCVCTDKNTNTLISKACVKCAGTGFEGGYFPGVEYPILPLSGDSQKSEITQIGMADIVTFQARGLAFPLPDHKDLWMEKDTSRVYEINSVQINTKYSFEPVSVQLELRELSLADSVSLIVSSLSGFAVADEKLNPLGYSSPIIIAEERTEPQAGVVSAETENPFAGLLQNTTTVSKENTVIVQAVTSPTNVTNVTIVNPVSDKFDGLDGGTY